MSSIETYSGNPLLKKANVNIEYTAKQIDEYIKCSKDPVYFAKTYVKIVSVDEGLVPFKMYKFQEKLIRNFHKNRFNICKMPRQCGKALALDTPIPTPLGWTTMGDLKVGDTILSPSGKSIRVLTKTEPMYNHRCYKIHFDNGDEIVADAEHLWEVNSTYWRAGKKILTTEDIVRKYKNKKTNTRGNGVQGSYYIEINKPLETFYNEELPIDPYLLGVWLGDGNSYDARITAHIDDYEFYKNEFDIGHCTITNNCCRFRPSDLHSKLNQESLIGNKHIPQKYLRASYESRVELLRGLMDTDGSVRPNTRGFEFYQKNYDLVLQIVELLSSLGIKSRVRGKLINGCVYYTVSFTTTEQVFKLPRKLNLISSSHPTRPQNFRIYIQKIEEVDSVPVACISVNSEDKLFLCGKTFIPTHNSTTAISYLMHYIIFNDNSNIALLANKAQTAKDLLGRLQLAYENLPKWLQQGVKIWNKASLELDNGSKIIASSTSGSAIRGGSYNIIFLDEFAFIPNQISDEFFSSVYPTITSGKSTKVIMVSTPKGMNSFYKFWTDAIRGKNEYFPTEVHWSEVPGRDEKWKQQTIANTSQEQWEQEFECSFLGSVDTLVSSAKLQCLVYNDPITRSEGLDVYEKPLADHNYMITVDVSEGTGKDYHAFVVIDITNIPYKLVAKYRNNELKPMLLPDIIYKVANSYNKAFVLIEIASVGDQVAKDLMFDLEYENLLMCSMRGRAGQLVGQGFSGKTSQLGIKMSKQVKRVGCSNLKTIIEDDKLIINDFDIISELTTFVAKNNSFEGEVGTNDDLSMCLVIFSWLIVQDYFKEMTNNDIRKRIYQEQKDQIEQDMSPFGFINDGISNEDEVIVEKETGDLWLISDGNNNNPIEVWNLDEYGDMSYMWDYR
jgi:hypothetical protein